MRFLKTFSSLLASVVLAGTSASAGAAAILFAHVDQTAPYVTNGDSIRDMLIADGHTVTTRFLNQSVWDDYATFDQIFVYDL